MVCTLLGGSSNPGSRLHFGTDCGIRSKGGISNTACVEAFAPYQVYYNRFLQSGKPGAYRTLRVQFHVVIVGPVIFRL